MKADRATVGLGKSQPLAGIGGELHEWHLDEFNEFQSKVAALEMVK